MPSGSQGAIAHSVMCRHAAKATLFNATVNKLHPEGMTASVQVDFLIEAGIDAGNALFPEGGRPL